MRSPDTQWRFSASLLPKPLALSFNGQRNTRSWSKEHLMRLCVEQPKGTLPWGEKLISSTQMRVMANVTFTQHMNVRCPRLLIAENATANFGLRLVAMYMSQVKRARSQPTQSPVPHESFPRQRDREEGSRKRRGTGRQHGEGERNQVTRAGRPEHSRGGRRQQRANKDEVRLDRPVALRVRVVRDVMLFQQCQAPSCPGKLHGMRLDEDLAIYVPLR